MIPVQQKISEVGSGDCFSACIASLLEMSLESVPNFRREAGQSGCMYDLAETWLKQRFALSLLRIQIDYQIIAAFKGTPCIAAGASPNRPGGYHAVVGEIDCLGNFTMTHDPNPSGKGIVGEPLILFFLVPMNPASVIYRRQGKY